MTVFDNICKHLEVLQEYSATFRILSSLLGVWKCGEHGLSCLKKHKVVAKGLYVLIDTTTQALATEN